MPPAPILAASGSKKGKAADALHGELAAENKLVRKTVQTSRTVGYPKASPNRILYAWWIEVDDGANVGLRVSQPSPPTMLLASRAVAITTIPFSSIHR